MFKIFALLIMATAVCQAIFSTTTQFKVKQATSRCARQLGVPVYCRGIYLVRMQTGDTSGSEPSFKKYVACTMGALGLVHTNGTINRQTVIDLLVENHNRTLVEEALQTCDVGLVEGVSLEDTAFNFWNCFWTKKHFEV